MILARAPRPRLAPDGGLVARRTLRFAVALALLVSGVGAARADQALLRAELAWRAAAVAGSVIELRRDLHAHPELSNREHRTAGLVAERLRALGYGT